MKHRLFLAIEMPRSHFEQVYAIQKNLVKISPNIQIEDLEKIHLTTNFIGRVEEERIPGMIKNLDKEISNHRKLTIQPYFVSSFYNRHEPSIIFLEPAGELSELKDIQKTINKELGTMMLPQQSRFNPHFTIARVDRVDPTSAKQILDKVQQLEITPLPPLNVDHISIFESMQSKAGTHYKKMGEFILP